MGQGTSLRSGSGRETLGEVRDRFGEPQKDPFWVGGPSQMFWTGRGTLREVRDRSGDSSGGLGWVG